MTTDELLESLDRHFLAGCPELSTSQLREHQRTGTCPECRGRASGSAAAAEKVPAPAGTAGEDGEHG